MPLITVTVALQAVLGLCLLLFGRWTRRRVHRLVPAHLDGSARDHRVRVLIRGARACQVCGLFLVIMVGASPIVAQL
jgi:hypothetical protein